MVRETLAKRFCDKVRTPSHDSECWEWLGAKVPRGYGMLKVVGKGGRNAHRVAYELFVGPIPEGMEIDHLCHNRGCVNPAHLEAVDHAENVRRRRCARLVTPTHCSNGHAYTAMNTRLRYWPSGKVTRVCLACVEIRNRSRVSVGGRRHG